MLTVRSGVIVLVLAGCQPGDPVGRPFDISQTRVQSRQGDRWEAAFGGPIRRQLSPNHHPASNGDWNYFVGGTVTAGSAIYNNAFSGGTLAASCSDRLFVASTSTSGDNLYAFDQLSKRPPGAPADCTATTNDNNCTRGPKPDRWCPHKLWSTALSGGVDRASLNLSADGTTVYAPTSAGMLYAVDTATGVAHWSFNARSDIGGNNNAGFIGSGAWVNYGDGSLYVAANYVAAATNRIRVYKLASNGTVQAKLDIANDGIASSVIAYDAIYFGSTTGKVYRIFDNGSSFSIANGWPIALWSAHGGANNSVVQHLGQPIFGTPAIDGGTNLLAVAVNNVHYTINVFTASIHSVEGGWQDGTQATANDVAEYSSPWIDPALSAVFLGHGKNQGGQEIGPRLHRREYNPDGSFVTATLTSVPTAGNSNDLTNPRSSPLVLHEPTGEVWVYIGDPQGNLNRWNYTNTFGTRQTFSGQNANIESPIIIDYLAGNIYFGDDSGRVYQISQSSLQ
jgi:hypothetical protein